MYAIVIKSNEALLEIAQDATMYVMNLYRTETTKFQRLYKT